MIFGSAMKPVAVIFLILLTLTGCSERPKEARGETSEETGASSVCIICGALEHPGRRDPDKYETWFHAHIEFPHGCDWAEYGRGCSHLILCDGIGGNASMFHEYFMELPVEVARRIVHGLISASREERVAVFPGGDSMDPPGLQEFSRLADGSAPNFDERWTAYLKKYAAWRRIWELGAS